MGLREVQRVDRRENLTTEFDALHFRSIGPATMSGRASATASATARVERLA